jgi:hypothetical protein
MSLLDCLILLVVAVLVVFAHVALGWCLIGALVVMVVVRLAASAFRRRPAHEPRLLENRRLSLRNAHRGAPHGLRVAGGAFFGAFKKTMKR